MGSTHSLLWRPVLPPFNAALEIDAIFYGQYMKSGEAEVHLGCICGCQTGMDIKWGSLHHLFLLGTDNCL